MEYTFDLCSDCFEGVLKDGELTLVSFNRTPGVRRCQVCYTRVATGTAKYRRSMTAEEATASLIGAGLGLAILGGLAAWSNRR